MSHYVPVAAGTEQRRIPAHQLNEKEMLWEFLRFARETIIAKTQDLSDEALRKPHVASGNSLGGILKHLTGGEINWFGNTLGGLDIPMPFGPDDPDGDWRVEDDESLETLVAKYRAACNSSDKFIFSMDLDCTGRQVSGDYTLRWVLTHMIAETNRHVGQADLMREMTDGVRGW